MNGKGGQQDIPESVTSAMYSFHGANDLLYAQLSLRAIGKSDETSLETAMLMRGKAYARLMRALAEISDADRRRQIVAQVYATACAC